MYAIPQALVLYLSKYIHTYIFHPLRISSKDFELYLRTPIWRQSSVVLVLLALFHTLLALVLNRPSCSFLHATFDLPVHTFKRQALSYDLIIP